MNDLIKRAYELLYSPIITPYNLLENAKLNNYSYVKYYKGDNGLIVEMKCSLSDTEKNNTIFYYYFDYNDSLISVYSDCGQGKTLLFNRDNEIKLLKESISKTKKLKAKSL